MNVVGLTGLLTAKPEVQLSKAGNKPYLRFTLAVRETYMTKEGTVKENTNFIPCVAFGGVAQAIAKYLDKGSYMALNGSVWVTQRERDGKKYQTVAIKVSEATWPTGKPAEKAEFGGPAPDLGGSDDDIPF